MADVLCEEIFGKGLFEKPDTLRIHCDSINRVFGLFCSIFIHFKSKKQHLVGKQLLIAPKMDLITRIEK